eukprot:g536.t1
MGQACSHDQEVYSPIRTQKRPPSDGTRCRRGSVSAEVAAPMLGKPVIKNVSVKSEDAYKRIIDSIKGCFLFNGSLKDYFSFFLFVSELDEDQLEDVILSMVERKVNEGEIIIQEGEDGDNFYVIESGIFEASKDGNNIAKYDHQGSFGELALMYNCPRAATITAVSDGILWVVDRCSFRNIIVASMSQKRLTYEGILDQMHIFKDLSAEKVSTIADCLTRELYSKGEVIVSEGTPLDSQAKFYIVEKGTIECFKTFEGEKKLVKTIEQSGFFGEVALISKLPRQADCLAKTDVCLLSLTRNAFERLLGPAERILQDRINEYNAFNENFQNMI